MTDHVHSRVNLLVRRVGTIVGRGRITSTNDGGSVQLVQVQVNDLETIDNLPRLAEFGLTSVAPDGADVAMVNFGGARNNAVVVATGHQQSRPTGLKGGETMLYSQDGKYVYLTAGGGIVVEAKGQAVTVNDATIVTINAATKVRMVTPRLECTGDIVDNCDTTGRSMAADRVIYDAHTHPVPNVQLGGPGTTTQQPNQPE
ncbi:MAG TPA: phage baseplate assembly protein V [Paraburkholderia sp.]